MRDYTAALRVHQAIVDLYPAIERARARFRKVDRPVRTALDAANPLRVGVDRDRALCALGLKAATTKEAIAQLCALELSDDAFTLSRVLIENAIVLAWLLHDDRPNRIDTYCLFTAVVRDRWREIIDRHYQDNPRMQAAAKTGEPAADAKIAEDVFDEKYQSWAWFRQEDGKLRNVRLSEMMSSMSSTPTEKLFLYEAVYFDASHWVHSAPPSIAAFGRTLEKESVYVLRVTKNRDRRTVALDLSNTAMPFLLAALDDWLSLGIADDLNKILTQIKNSRSDSGPPSPGGISL